jgi:hypothetical protein
MRELDVVTPVPTDVWNKVLTADPRSLPFQTPAWMAGICAGGRYRDESRLYTMPTARIVVPLAGRRMLPGLAAAAALPHGMGVGGMLSDAPMTVETLRAVMSDLSRLPYISLLVRPNPLHGEVLGTAAFDGWRAIPRTTHILDLSGGFDEVWNRRVGGEKRNKFRKSIKAGLELRHGNDEALLRAFYDIYMKWCGDRSRRNALPGALARWLGRRREPYWKLAGAARAMGEGCRIYLACRDGRPVATAILLIAGASAAYWRSASDTEASAAVAANDFLQHHMIRHACEAGCTNYYMGESGGVASLMKFKESYGAKPFAFSEYRCEPRLLAAARDIYSTRGPMRPAAR